VFAVESLTLRKEASIGGSGVNSAWTDVKYTLSLASFAQIVEISTEID
jgi:hypothetical protein